MNPLPDHTNLKQISKGTLLCPESDSEAVFILLSAGCAIGIGNVWKFPWMAGQYGGAIFVLIYIACLVVLGVPVMTMEFAVGRAAQRSPSLMFQQLEKKGSKWHWHGIVCLAGLRENGYRSV